MTYAANHHLHGYMVEYSVMNVLQHYCFTGGLLWFNRMSLFGNNKDTDR